MKIKRDGEILDVTKGAYREYFEGNGWKPVNEKEEEKKEESFEIDETDNEEEDEEEDDKAERLAKLFEKPVNKFSQKEAEEFAEAYNLDIAGKNRKEVIAIIEAYIEENK